jgi:hypothetical protein
VKLEKILAQFPSARHYVGGTGLDLSSSLPPEVKQKVADYSLYDIDYGVGFLSRGCPRRCKFCVVPEKEGDWRQAASIGDIVNPKSNFIVLLDNNFLADRDWAIAQMREMQERDLVVNFSQGLDIRFVDQEIALALSGVQHTNTRNTYKQVTFAFDHIGIERQVRDGVAMLHHAGVKNLQFFVLVGFNSTFEEDMERVEILRDLDKTRGCHVDPYIMVYRDPISGKKKSKVDRRLHHFARWVNARLWRSVMWDEYEPWVRERNEYFRNKEI